MLNNPHFYHRSIRKIVVGFGTLFNDIELLRYDDDGIPKARFKVPLSYGAKEKYITRLTSDPTMTKSIMTLVPRIAFNLDGMSYDPLRKQLTTVKNFTFTDGNMTYSYVPVPYNFDFSLSIFVRNTEDGTQILEQILPFFTPDYTLTVTFVPGSQITYDMPIILDQITSGVEYEGDFSTTRLIIWDLHFTVKGFVFPPTKGGTGGPLIRRANTYISTTLDALYRVDANTLPDISVINEVDPITANPDDEYGFKEIINENYGLENG